jgi:hypothetical protein
MMRAGQQKLTPGRVRVLGRRRDGSNVGDLLTRSSTALGLEEQEQFELQLDAAGFDQAGQSGLKILSGPDEELGPDQDVLRTPTLAIGSPARLPQRCEVRLDDLVQRLGLGAALLLEQPLGDLDPCRRRPGPLGLVRAHLRRLDRTGTRQSLSTRKTASASRLCAGVRPPTATTVATAMHNPTMIAGTARNSPAHHTTSRLTPPTARCLLPASQPTAALTERR